MKVLFIGGTGVISSACTSLALKRGIEVWHLNRGKTLHKRAISQVPTLHADIRDPKAVSRVLDNKVFDVVVNWIAFEESHVRQDYNLFKDRCDQYIYISSASAYETPPSSLPISEHTPLYNPIWKYSQDKIAGERVLSELYTDHSFNYTIIRPSHTYDQTSVPIEGGTTTLYRIKNHLPVAVYGDGTSLWTLTHSRDFAKAFIGLLGNEKAYNQAFHITSDEWLSWNQIFGLVGNALGIEPVIKHIPSEIMVRYLVERRPNILSDKMHSTIFDNTKIKSVVPEFEATTSFEQGAREIVEWHLANPQWWKVDPHYNAQMDQLTGDY